MRLRAEKGSDLIEQTAETRGRGESFEPTHRPVPRLDAPMILFQLIVYIAVRPVRHSVPENMPDGP